MKRKFEKNASKTKEGVDKTFGKPHEQLCYDLSKKIWGKSASASGGSELKANGKGKRTPKPNMTPDQKEKHASSLQIPQVVKEEPVRENSSTLFCLSELAKTKDVVGLSMASKNTNQAAGPPSHHQYSQMFGNDHIDGERANDGSSKKCTSSHDSYSIEQSGDTFESDRKVPHDTSQQRDDGFESDHNVPHDASQPESPCCCKDCDNDDFYSEILKDDIVKLFDESSLTTSQNSRPVISRRTEQHHMRSASPSMVPLQGTARRRIRFDTSKVDLDELEKHLNPPEPQSIVSRLKAASLSSILVLVLLIGLAYGIPHTACPTLCKDPRITSDIQVSASLNW